MVESETFRMSHTSSGMLNDGVTGVDYNSPTASVLVQVGGSGQNLQRDIVLGSMTNHAVNDTSSHWVHHQIRVGVEIARERSALA